MTEDNIMRIVALSISFSMNFRTHESNFMPQIERRPWPKIIIGRISILA